MMPIENSDQQRFPYEHIPIGGRVCFTIPSTVFYDSGSVVKGDLGTRVESKYGFPGIWITWDDIPGMRYQVVRRQLRYPIIEIIPATSSQ